MSDRHPLATNPTNQQTTTMNRQTCITVTHEDLLWVLSAITTPHGGLHLCNCHQRPGRVHLDSGKDLLPGLPIEQSQSRFLRSYEPPPPQTTDDPGAAMTQTDLQAVGAAFNLRGRFVGGSPYGSGHINDTYAVRYDSEGRQVRYVLQRVNRKVFRDVPAVMENVERVTSHLRATLEKAAVPDRSRRAMNLLPTRDGGIYHIDPAGEYWRAYEFVEGAATFDVLTSHEQAFEVARAFGAFQKMLADLPEPPLHETIPRFHDGPDRYRAFLDALERDPLGRAAGARPEIAYLKEQAATLDRYPQLIARGAVPLRVTHNDCKSNNVLIDDETGEGICVIDLDTLMPGLVMYDFGDMVRTSTCAVAEDWQILDDVHMDLERFEHLTRGYLSAAGDILTPVEIDELAFAGQAITLTLGARFLTDHLLGDTYFKTHRPDHNLERCRVQFALVRSMAAQEAEMEAAVERAARENRPDAYSPAAVPAAGARLR